MIPFAIEEVIPKNDPMLRKQREKVWLRNYDALTRGQIPDFNFANSNFLKKIVSELLFPL